jgi:agmatinase
MTDESTNEPLTTAPRAGFQSFHDFPIRLDLDKLDADIAILGIPYGEAYSIDEVSNDQTNAPAHIRQYCERALRGLDRWDFDIGGTLFDGRPVRVEDCGNIIGDPRDPRVHSRRAELAIGKILAAGALPIVLGGDHSIPIPVFRAYHGRGPITLVQVDAHIDWRDHMHGVRNGLSSPMRRASEMAHFDRIYQIGLRSAGSARREEVEAALAWGSVLIPDIELQETGMEAVLARIPDGGQYYLTIDADGLDPAIMPAVAGPAPGGVTYAQMRTLIHGLIEKGRVVGMDIVEITPKRDVNGISAITAGRLIVNLIGKAVRAGYFAK